MGPHNWKAFILCFQTVHLLKLISNLKTWKPSISFLFSRPIICVSPTNSVESMGPWEMGWAAIVVLAGISTFSAGYLENSRIVGFAKPRGIISKKGNSKIGHRLMLQEVTRRLWAGLPGWFLKGNIRFWSALLMVSVPSQTLTHPSTHVHAHTHRHPWLPPWEPGTSLVGMRSIWKSGDHSNLRCQPN